MILMLTLVVGVVFLIWVAIGIVCKRSAVTSVACTLVSVPTMFLVVKIFIIPGLGLGLGLFFGWKAYRQYMREHPMPESQNRAAASLPMIFASLVLIAEVVFIDSTYQA
jgi:hypothetical protein